MPKIVPFGFREILDQEPEILTGQQPQMPALPEDVVDLLRKMRDEFVWIATSITGDIYNDRINREGVSIDCNCFAEKVEMLLTKYEYFQ